MQFMYNKIYFSLFILASIFFVGCKTDRNNSTSTTEKLEISFIKEGTLDLIEGGKTIKSLDIEIAEDEYERMNGLMNRSKMDENKGMLFLFEKPNIQQFWMKNTRIPLDIIYIGEDKKVINISRNAEPFLEKGVSPSSSPAKYVLEINGGNSEKWGIKEGITQIEWQLLEKK